MSDFVSAIRESDYIDRYLYQPATVEDVGGGPYPFTTSHYAGPDLATWDAKTLTNMVVTGVVDTNSPLYSTVEGNEVESFKINTKYTSKLNEINLKLFLLKSDHELNYVTTVFASMKDEVTQYDALQKSMLENIGEITFGVPIVYTAAEMGLVIPTSIRKLYDVYWADLVVTYRGVDPNDLAEMAFNVAVPEQSVALKLVPLRFGLEVTHSEKKTTPEMSVEYAGAKVSIGEYFSQTVAYTFSKADHRGLW